MSKRKNSTGGFTLVELAVVLIVMLVMFAVGMPSFLRAYSAYRLNNAAAGVAGVLQSTRFQAIRLNTRVNCLIQQNSNGATNVWADSNGDGIEQSTENQFLLSGVVTLVPAANVPNIGNLATAIGVSTLTAISPTNGTATFDARGAVSPPGVYVLCVGYVAHPNAGARAVVLMPSGIIQTWSTDAAGNWWQIN